MNKKLVSIIVPVFNEELNIKNAYITLKNEFKKLKISYDLEIVFINDGSTDKSRLELQQISDSDKNVKVIEFSRNFGKEIALTAGINNCTGDSCILFDCDLQYPVSTIPQFLESWMSGSEVVIGIRNKGKKERNIIKRFGSELYYMLSNNLLGIKSVKGAIDFRLLDRIVINEFNNLSERNRMTRALIDWLGFKKDYIYYSENPREIGKSTQSLYKLIKLAFDGIVSQTLFPLKFAGYLGVVITLFSGVAGIFIIIEKYTLNDPWNFRFSGPAILAIINMFLVGIVLVCMGLIALYIANIHYEVNNRPLYIIRKKRNF